MLSARVAFLFLAFLATMLATLAAPIVDVTASEEHELERRIDHWGQVTYYEPGLGACGWNSGAGDYVVAIPAGRYDATSPRGGNCGQWMHIVNTDNGNSVDVITVDRCEGCGSEHVDLSPAAFGKLGAMDKGVLPVKWNFYPMGYNPNN